MRVWIATDWYGTMVFTAKPKLIYNYNGTTEWYGNRCADFERLLPKTFEQKDGECTEANIQLTIQCNTK